MKTYYDLSLIVYTVSAFSYNWINFINFVNYSNNRSQISKKQKTPQRPKQKNRDTSTTLNNVVLSFEKATPINYDRNNLFTP